MLNLIIVGILFLLLALQLSYINGIDSLNKEIEDLQDRYNRLEEYTSILEEDVEKHQGCINIIDTELVRINYVTNTLRQDLIDIETKLEKGDNL